MAMKIETVYAAVKLKKASGYPKCLLWVENIGCAGIYKYTEEDRKRLKRFLTEVQYG